eukprot:TRINITY_DN2938_c0_g4_i4.p1 TRINITY_DN2938_c0_g4~~TRINITY_DN2938_c0_g4_i4.p1  ORF type:complete len:363 (-),score=145.48 TRINITY_DN2938_c0_g4_i4:16-1104(-)
MTNRMDMIDDALLRPGRLEVHIEIGLADEKGRVQILNIHTKKMRESGVMSDDVSIEELAANTKNFSGAEIEGLVKSATSFALNRLVNASNLAELGEKDLENDLVVQKHDFELALSEITPAFGIDEDMFEACGHDRIVVYNDYYQQLLDAGSLLTRQVESSTLTPLVSALVVGEKMCGKTAFAARLALNSDFPFVQLISPSMYVGMTELKKAQAITKVFEDSYKSAISCILIDDLERLLDYVPIGQRFSNTVLQTLLVLINRPPPKGRKLLILATTSNKEITELMGLNECFSTSFHVPKLEANDAKECLKPLNVMADSDLERIGELITEPIAVGKLMMLVEMARGGDQYVSWDKLNEVFLLNN